MTLDTIVAALLILTSAFADDTTNAPKNNSTFKDFIEKYEPSTVWEQIDKKKSLKSVNLTREEEFDMFFKGIDPTDELLGLRVVNGDASILLEKSGRRWRPPGKLSANKFDPWSIKRRLLELMKQAIYQARNKMVIMQEFRAKKRKNALYKMGFLFAKTDLMTKVFASFATKSFAACSMKRQTATYSKHLFIDIVHTHERLMQLWFDLDLMVDVIDTNDIIGHRVLEKYTGVDRVKAFDQLFAA